MPLRITVPKSTNQLNVRATMFAIRKQLESDAGLRKLVKKDPIGVLERFGISRAVAVAIVADDAGVPVIAGGGVAMEITKCCCSACSVSKFRISDIESLPAPGDITGWSKLAKSKATPRISASSLKKIGDSMRSKPR